MTLRPGVRTTAHWRVGRYYVVRGTYDAKAGLWCVHGRCVSVTPWGNGQVRWVRLQHPNGEEKSYAPSHLGEAHAGMRLAVL